MCIAVVAWAASPRWRLVAAANRDEYHARPAAPAARWDGPGQVLAGRDLQSGGTWLGLSGAGRFALVTNVRGHGPPAADRASRGALVADVLTGTGHYADLDALDPADFNAFNLIAVDRHRARFLSNRPAIVRRDLPPGVYGLSNGALDEPWPKTVQLKASLAEWLDSDGTPSALFDALASETLPSGPASSDADAPLSSIFVRDPLYGTRCSTIVAVAANGAGVLLERRFAADGSITGETALDFSWPGVVPSAADVSHADQRAIHSG